MKYEKEVNEVLDLIYGEYINDEDMKPYVNVLKVKLSNDIQVGIDNGYSLEIQMDLFRQLVKDLKK